MDFFKKFAELYNNIHSKKEFIKIIPPCEEEWIKFNKKLEKTNEQKKEQIYLMILHYHFLHEKKMIILPYTLKQKGDSIHIPYSEIPCVLQHMLIEFIEI
jgi:hypothetical protein